MNTIFPLVILVTHVFIKQTQVKVFEDLKRIIKKNFVLKRSFHNVRHKTISFVSSTTVNILLKYC